MLDEILTLHNIECDAYELMWGIKDFPLAEIYYLKKADEHTNGVILMEDLSEQCTTLGMFRTVTAEHCLEVAKSFADFQVGLIQQDRDLFSADKESPWY